MADPKTPGNTSKWTHLGVFIVGGMVGVSAGIFLGFILFPFVFPPQ